MPDLPENATIDLHDLAAIFMHERMLASPRFSKANLVEINDGSAAVQTPGHTQSAWTRLSAQAHRKRIGYFLTSSAAADASTVTPETFISAQGLIKPPGFHDLSPKEVETAFWRCRNFDSGYHLVYAMQTLLDSLPESTNLRLRTKDPKYSITCSAKDFVITEVTTFAKEFTFISHITPAPELGPTKFGMEQHSTGGDDGTLPWVYLLFGQPTSPNVDEDTRIVLDLASCQLGFRGPGGEIFSMERIETYHGKTLARAANELDPMPTLSGRLQISVPEDKEVCERLARTVRERLRQVLVEGARFCAYCGAKEPTLKCSKCSEYFCSAEHQRRGWPFSKSYCGK